MPSSDKSYIIGTGARFFRRVSKMKLKQTVVLQEDRELTIVWHETKWYAQTTDLHGALGLSEGGSRKLLGKLGIQSLKLDSLKRR